MEKNTFDFKTMNTKIAILAAGAGMNIKQLAATVGCNYNTFTKYMRDVHHMPHDVIIEVAHALNCDVAYLLGEQDEPVRKYGGISTETGLSYSAGEAICTASPESIETLSWFIEHGLIDLLAMYRLTAVEYDALAAMYGLRFDDSLVDPGGRGHDLISNMHKADQQEKYNRLVMDYITSLR